MSSEQADKYEAWIHELETRRAKLAGDRPRYLRFFASVPILSAAGFLFGSWIGAATLFTGVLVWAFGSYVVLVREGDYTREIDAARIAATRMRQNEEARGAR